MDPLDDGYAMALAGALVWTPRSLRSFLDSLGTARSVIEWVARHDVPPEGVPALSDQARQRVSAIDDRTHNGMDISSAAAAKAPAGAVYVVTHVDVPPPKKDDCIAALKGLIADSRKEAGSARFDIFQQGSRPNHFTVVEIWKGQKAYDNHITAPHTKKFRDTLTPMSGALYDERTYKAL